MNIIANRIISLRDDRDMKQKDLADAIGVTKATMCKYENSQTIPNAVLISQLANALDTNTDYLLGRTDDKSPTKAQHAGFSSADMEFLAIYKQLSPLDRIRCYERALVLKELSDEKMRIKEEMQEKRRTAP